MKYIQIILLLMVLMSPLGATKYAGEIFSFSPGVVNQAMGNTGLTFAGSMAAGWWNPALLAERADTGVELMRSEHFEGLLSQNQISLRLGKDTSLIVNHLAIDKVKLTKLEHEDDPLSNDNRPYVWKTVTNQDLIIYGGFARALRENLYVGISPKLAYRDLAEHSGYGFGADLGALWNAGKGVSLGVNLRDFFGTQILWESGEHEIALPNLDFESSYGFTMLKYDIPIVVLARIQAFAEERGSASNLSSSGISADLHSGFLVQPIPALKLMAGYDVDSFTAGLGLQLKALGLNYAFKNRPAEGLGYTQKVSLSYSW
jgi:hypothetical protein